MTYLNRVRNCVRTISHNQHYWRTEYAWELLELNDVLVTVNTRNAVIHLVLKAQKLDML